jgi:GTP-binding protein Era
MTTTQNKKTHCGYIAILGRPNVGKSTLLNHLLGKKLSITSDKPQTTRHQILGIKTVDDTQYVYVDTPGMHLKAKRAVNRMMNKAAKSAVHDVDIIVFVVDSRHWTDEDELVLQTMQDVACPVILAMNKIDMAKDKPRLLQAIDEIQHKRNFHAIIPLSVIKNENVDVLEKTVKDLLPENPFLFGEEQLTTRDEKFLSGEIIREKLMRRTGQEIPYDTAVTIETLKMEKEIMHIHATIWVEREGQRRIIIGKKGEKLKTIGQDARKDLEQKFGCQVYLNLWVKVKEGWSDDEKLLSQVM